MAVFASSEIKEPGERSSAQRPCRQGRLMLIEFLHGLAVSLALLGIVLLDRAFAQSAPNAGTEEIATFASRFSALTDASAAGTATAATGNDQRAAGAFNADADAGAAVRSQRDAGDRR